MDAISQRKLVAAVAVGIISKQLYDIYGYCFDVNTFTTVTLTRWCVTYAIFFFGLWFFQIERLQFRFFAVVVFSVLSVFWNIGVYEVARFMHGDTNALVISNTDNTPVVIAQAPKENHKYVRNSNLAGSHYIHFVPYARGALNPNGTSYCISEYNSQVEIPILIKGTPPYKIKYEFTDFESNETSINEYEFTVTNEKINIDDKPKVRRHVLPIKKTGKIHLIGLEDDIYGEGKVDVKNSKDAIIVKCPVASFTENFVEVCVADNYDVQFSASGVGPLNIWYTEKINDQSSVSDVFQTGESKEEMKFLEIRDFIHLNFPVSGPHLLKIASVMDRYNNTMWYSDEKFNLNKEVGFEVNAKNAQSVSTLIDVRPKPTARLESKDVNLLLNQKAKVKVYFEGTGPWTLSYTFLNNVVEIPKELIEKNKIVVEDIKQNPFIINVENPGILKLLSVQDSYCKGEVILPSDSLIQLIYPPEVEIAKEPIYESCPDPIGMRFNVTFVGEPPFELKYSYTNENTNESKIESIRSNQSRFIFNGTPKTPGKYIYKFLSLSDVNYINVPLNISKTDFPVHPPSDAVFVNTKKIYSCVGETVTLPINLSGTGPWSLKYDILHGRVRTSKTIKNISTFRYNLLTETFAQAGSYSYELSSIIDSNGCIKDIKHSSPVIIEVFGHTPKAYFAGDSEESRRQYITLDDSNGVYLPVRIEGKPPFDLNYTLINDDKHIMDKSIWNQNALLKVYKPGVYELTGIHDKYCPGVIETPKQFEVRGILRPTISIIEGEVTKKCENESEECLFSRQSICENESDELAIEMTGKPPFKVKYSITDDEKGKEMLFTENISQYKTKLALYTNAITGNYTIKLLSISDANYSKPSKLTDIIHQEVKSKPHAQFVSSKKKLFQCVGESSDMLELNLQGKAPFNVKLSYRHNGRFDMFELPEIQENTHKFSVESYVKDVGIYTFYIRSVSDATNCIYEEEENDDNAAFVEVSDVAKIWSTSSPEVCVDDILFYTLSGIGPFTVYYSLNDGEEVPVKANDNQLKLRAGEPGTVTITRACNVMGCCTKPVGLVHIIHSWPTAKINEGNDIIEELREGEGDMGKIVVDFTGVPPFDFTYSHKVLKVGIHQPSDINQISPQDIKSEKQVSLVGINEYRYVFESSEEGLYVVSAVSDKYCGHQQSFTSQTNEQETEVIDQQPQQQQQQQQSQSQAQAQAQPQQEKTQEQE